jgi:hypothetical protein
MIEILPSNLRFDQLHTEVTNFLGKNDFWEKPQVSLTSVTGENDWFCSVGKIEHLQYPERAYSVINKELQGTYIAEVINEYSKFYRWRLLNLQQGSHYSVHSDNMVPSKKNKRIHIPIVTNDQAFFCYYNDKPANGVKTEVEFHVLQPGTVYEIDTSRLHSAINYSEETRVHLVGVRYE